MKCLDVLLVGLVGLVACSSNVEGGGSAGSGGSGGSGGDGGAGSSSSSGGLSVQCVGTTPVFPTFDKTCTVVSDCATALHTINCCGTMTAIGINIAEEPAFTAAEATCDMQYPACGCAQSPTTTEDGKTSLDDTLIQVGCMNGQCMTFLP